MKILLILSFFCLSLNGAQTLTIGSVADDPSKEFKEFTPIMEYIKNNTPGIDEVQLKIFQSIPAISTAINNKEVDLYIDSPFSVEAVCLTTKAIPLWRRWKKGSKEYTSVIFTMRTRPLQKLDDLKGKVIAFEERYSSSSYLLPKFLMEKEGLKLLHINNLDERVPPESIGYIFTQDDATTMFWVLRNKVAAGAMSNKSYVKKAKKRISKLNILKESKSFPRHVVCLRPDFPVKITAELQKTLLNMHTTTQGNAILQTFSKTTKFDILPEKNKKDMLETQNFIKKEFNIK
ncbi:MAG: phosphate/phosphite/phosphonate ABC transporter substrate-binding protein [Lentisphaeraceae bacterium]|nr:phosphate/phosphite/phosphonate ABC transporter substrate-binding protein [Lentisphaeraceae bacterium]